MLHINWLYTEIVPLSRELCLPSIHYFCILIPGPAFVYPINTDYGDALRGVWGKEGGDGRVSC